MNNEAAVMGVREYVSGLVLRVIIYRERRYLETEQKRNRRRGESDEAWNKRKPVVALLHRRAPARDSLDLGCGVTRSDLGAPCYFYASISTLKYRSLCIIGVTPANHQSANLMTQLQGHLMLALHVKLMLKTRRDGKVLDVGEDTSPW